MQINILPLHLVLHAEQRQRIAERVRHALWRLAGRVRRVEVRLADVNGPRGGADLRCRVLLHLDGGEPLLVEERGDHDAPALVGRAMERAVRAARKRVGLLTQPRHVARHGRLIGAG